MKKSRQSQAAADFQEINYRSKRVSADKYGRRQTKTTGANWFCCQDKTAVQENRPDKRRDTTARRGGTLQTQQARLQMQPCSADVPENHFTLSSQPGFAEKAHATRNKQRMCLIWSQKDISVKLQN